MNSDFKSSVARIFNLRGEVVGSAFLASDNLVVTCAHVIIKALDISDQAEEVPPTPVKLDFPLVARGEKFEATVLCWYPPGRDKSKRYRDIAVLELEFSDHSAIKPLRLVDSQDVWDHSFRVFGVPSSYDQGVWVKGRLRDRQADGWIQIESEQLTGYSVTHGFSGAALLDEVLDGAIGMVVGADRRPETKAAYIIPTSDLIAACPQLSDFVVRIAKSQPSSLVENYPSFKVALIRLGARSISFKRENLLNDVLELIHNGPLPIILLHGLPGSGKTTLVVELARKLQGEFTHALAIRFDQPAAIEPAYFVDEINEFLKAIGRGIDRNRLGEQSFQTSFDALMAQFSDLRLVVFLVGIDLLPSPWLDLILSGFTVHPQIRVVGTAQKHNKFEARAHLYLVPSLSTQESLGFVRQYANVFGLDINTEELAERLPESIFSNPEALTTLLAQLRNVPLELLMSEGIPSSEGSPQRLVEQIITLMSESEKRALALTDLLAETEINEALSALGLPKQSGLMPAIQVLAANSLVNKSGGGYTVPALVSSALKAAAPEDCTRMASIITESLQKAIQEMGNDGRKLTRIAPLSISIISRLKDHKLWQLILDLTEERYLELLNVRAFWKEYLLILRLGLEAADKMDRDVLRFRFSCRLARKLLQMGERDEACTLLNNTGSYQVEHGDWRDLADSHSHRALLLILEQKAETAKQELEKSRAIRLSHGDTEGLAIIETLAGSIHLNRREYAEARGYYEVALTYFADPTSRYAVDVETSLAQCDLEQGFTEAAEARLLKMKEICERLKYDAILPRALYHLARALDMGDKTEEAERVARQAAEASRSTDRRLASAALLMAQRLERLGRYMKES